MMSCRRVEKESVELLYTFWSLVMVRNQLPAQVVKDEPSVLDSPNLRLCLDESSSETIDDNYTSVGRSLDKCLTERATLAFKGRVVFLRTWLVFRTLLRELKRNTQRGF